jgi:prolyl 4-hydroxylase
MVNVENSKLRGGGSHMKNKIWEAARPTIEAWTGMKLQPSSLYGIRVYTEGAILAPHVDRYVSCLPSRDGTTIIATDPQKC